MKLGWWALCQSDRVKWSRPLIKPKLHYIPQYITTIALFCSFSTVTATVTNNLNHVDQYKEIKYTRGMQNVLKPPAPPAQKPHIIETHGHKRTDPFFWLKEKENPAVMDYINTENQYIENVMQHTQPLQQQLYDEMKGRIKETDSTYPYKLGPYLYYKRSDTLLYSVMINARDGSTKVKFVRYQPEISKQNRRRQAISDILPQSRQTRRGWGGIARSEPYRRARQPQLCGVHTWTLLLIITVTVITITNTVVITIVAITPPSLPHKEP